jgi:hypothetical protein
MGKYFKNKKYIITRIRIRILIPNPKSPHKIYAVGEAEKKGDPQSSTVLIEYEMHNGTARPKLKEMDDKDHNNKNAPEGAIKNLGATKMHDDN